MASTGEQKMGDPHRTGRRSRRSAGARGMAIGRRRCRRRGRRRVGRRRSRGGLRDDGEHGAEQRVLARLPRARGQSVVVRVQLLALSGKRKAVGAKVAEEAATVVSAGRGQVTAAFLRGGEERGRFWRTLFRGGVWKFSPLGNDGRVVPSCLGGHLLWKVFLGSGWISFLLIGIVRIDLVHYAR